jgi:hypothetical protein
VTSLAGAIYEAAGYRPDVCAENDGKTGQKTGKDPDAVAVVAATKIKVTVLSVCSMPRDRPEEDDSASLDPMPVSFPPGSQGSVGRRGDRRSR